MKRFLISLCSAVFALGAMAQNSYDLNAPFGFCTRSSRTTATAYDITGGGCYTYPIPSDFTGKVVVLKSNGQDMKSTIQNTIKNGENKVIIFDGSDGDFYVSSNVPVTASNKTLLGINNARICTTWHVTDEIKAALDAAGVPGMSTSSGGGTLPNGQYVSEEAEYNTRKIIMQMTGDNTEKYRNSGILTFNGCQNITIRNITFVGPGSIDVGGSDLISSLNSANHIWVDHCAFTDGMDGNFDITQSADFHTVSWCTFSYTDRSYMHQNTNLIGSSDSEATGFLNTTFAFNWWGEGCKQRMPMARVGKIHMLNNYFTSTTAGNCINPRKNSEFLIEGNYIAEGVKHYYGESSSKAVTWKSDNYIAEGSIPDSKGSTVTVPYTYTVAPYSIVPETVKQYAGATLFTETPSEIQSLDNMTPSSIDPNTPIYNLAGQRVDKNYKGIVIKNGKKIFIK
jgi:pectate lyase